MAGIRPRYSDRQRAIITEAGLARMYKYPDSPAGDVGWLYPADPISQESYWNSLNWYNGEMVRDDYALGCCLYQVGESGQWISFRHLGKDNSQQPLTIIPRCGVEPGAASTTPAATSGDRRSAGAAAGVFANSLPRWRPPCGSSPIM